MLGMIFLKKIFMLIPAVIFSLVFAGCGDKKNKDKVDKADTPPATESIETSTEAPSAEPATAPAITSPALKKAEGNYIYDNAKLLSGGDAEKCNDYSEWLYENRLINTAVVTTNDLGGLSPAEYAEKAYIDIYSGRGSGLLVLINNDTNEDYIYKKGSCAAYIGENDEKLAVYWATREIVSGDIGSAVLRLLHLGEACPEYIFDNGGIFTAEQADLLEDTCSRAKNNVCVLATSNSTGSSNEEICQTYHDRRYSDEKGCMIMLDTASNTLTVVSDSDLPNGIDADIADANKLAAEKNYVSAVNTLIAALKG